MELKLKLPTCPKTHQDQKFMKDYMTLVYYFGVLLILMESFISTFPNPVCIVFWSPYSFFLLEIFWDRKQSSKCFPNIVDNFLSRLVLKTSLLLFQLSYEAAPFPSSKSCSSLKSSQPLFFLSPFQATLTKQTPIWVIALSQPYQRSRPRPPACPITDKQAVRQLKQPRECSERCAADRIYSPCLPLPPAFRGLESEQAVSGVFAEFVCDSVVFTKVYEPQSLLISVVGTHEHANGIGFIYWKLHHVYLWFSESAWKIFFLWRRIWAVRMSIQNTVAKTPIVDKGLDAQTIKKLWVYCSSQYQPDLYEE